MKKVIALLLAFTMVFALCACGSSKTEASNETAVNTETAEGSKFEPMTIQIGSANPSTDSDIFYVTVMETSKRLEEWTDGAVKLEYIGDGATGNDSELAEGLKIGTLDGAIIVTSVFASSVPCVGLFDMPYVFENAEAVYDFVDNSDVIHTIYDKIEDQYNAKVIGWGHNGFRNTLNNVRPITCAADFEGLKIRVMESPVYMELFSLLGANPTPMAISECLTGLEQKTVDGMDHPVAASYNAGGYKLVKYFDLTQHTATEMALCIRADLFESFSPELQDLFYKAAAEAQIVAREKLASLEDQMLSEIETYGTQVGRNIDVASIREKLAPMYAEYRDSLDPEVFDAAMEYLGITY